ncbi:hypothetical protein [Flavobacterium luteum]|uniref:Uncharacterized protein n=1 Tax=Flavobacterium luteum TaxID=2026654 RepID=A0A7J5AK50_9FLAO|nr:hypothetical protein [Flavobacterium luteum]KAB1157981.1 hypothetical protein F6464_02540 [Flavobacterium luteum]
MSQMKDAFNIYWKTQDRTLKAINKVLELRFQFMIELEEALKAFQLMLINTKNIGLYNIRASLEL